MPDEKKPSPVESIKRESRFLRGEIPEELVDENDHFGKDSVQLLKHHGTYQQDDRDLRGGKSAGGKSARRHMFMVRTKLPAGILSSRQLLAELDLCDELGNSTLRVTSRQGLQLHGVLKRGLKDTIRRINAAELTTLGACGDVERNVMCCPAPLRQDTVRAEMQQLAFRLADHLAPRSGAYRECWLTDPETGEKELVGSTKPEEVEPIYRDVYLPRKFKTAIALPEDNCIDVYTHDLGLLTIVEDGRIVGYNVLVGGGQGVTPSAKKTFPALAKRMAFVRPEQVVDVATAIVEVQRDFGNRSDRKVARLKYLIADWGIDAFRAKVEEYYGVPLDDLHPADVHEFDDHMGWHDQGDGRFFYGLNIENGRIHDTDTLKLKTALRQICSELAPGIHLTSHQSVLLTDLAEDARDRLAEILAAHGVTPTEEVSNARRWSMACVAWPTCGLSITESERALPGMIDQLEGELARLGLDAERFTIRMTGCPNGCARPYNSDVGLVGKAKGKYTIFLGGRLLGDRLSFIYKDLVPADEVIPSLVAVFAHFKTDRETGETFGDFCHRQGAEKLAAAAENWAAHSGD